MNPAAIAVAREINKLVIKRLRESGLDIPAHCLPLDSEIAEIIETDYRADDTAAGEKPE
jgi:hypothetical protein